MGKREFYPAIFIEITEITIGIKWVFGRWRPQIHARFVGSCSQGGVLLVI